MGMLSIALRNTARMGRTFFWLAMKKSIPVIWAVVMLLSACSALAELSDYDIVTSAQTNKVILDCDMGYLSDDAYCMFILAQADAAGYIDFLGVTSVGGNEICAVGINAILNQLEAIERPDIPVYAGTDIPMMGFRNLAADQPITRLFMDRLYAAYLENSKKSDYCWDTITAAIFLCPDLITETEFRDLAIDCNRTGYSYANAVTWASGTGPYASRNVQIIFNIDRDAFWTFVTDLYGAKF